jgi:hypothetical protein
VQSTAFLSTHCTSARKLRADNFDPREYLSRLEAWRFKVEKGGSRWRGINDLDRLDGLL